MGAWACAQEKEKPLSFFLNLSASDVNFNIPKNEKPENSGMELVTTVQGHHLRDARGWLVMVQARDFLNFAQFHVHKIAI